MINIRMMKIILLLTKIRSTKISLVSTVIFVFLLAFAGQNLFAQTPCSEDEKPKPREPSKQVTKSFLLEVLGRESICVSGTEKPIPLSLRNSSLLSYIRKNGINFVLTPKIEEQLTTAGASNELMAAIKRENAKVTDPKLVFINLGDEANISKNYEEAITNYTEALNLDPDNRIAYINRGTAYKRFGDKFKGEKNFEEANKKYEEAISDFTQAIRVDSTNRNAYNNRGSCYYEKYTNNNVQEALANMEKAIADYTMAINSDEKFIEAYKNRALAYQFMGKKELADADLQKIKDLRNAGTQ